MAEARGFVWIGAGMLVLALAGCAPGAPRELLHSPYPPDRARAAIAAGEARDFMTVPRLVALLEDDDPGVRFYASLALEQITARTYGYSYHDSELGRQAAVQRWRDALRSGEVSASRPAERSTAHAAP